MLKSTNKMKDVLMLVGLVGLSTLLTVPNTALAVPFSADLSITGAVKLDPNTTTPTAGSQSATYSATSGGSTLAPLTCAVNCVTGSANSGGFTGIGLTELGDGVGIITAVSGSGAFALNEFFLNDYTIDLVNNSLTDTFKVTFLIDYSQNDASITGFAAAKAKLDVDRQLPGPPTNELFSFGSLDPSLTIPSLGPFMDSGMINFDITLAPGEIGMVEGKQDIEGIALNGSYTIDQDMFISVVTVMNLTSPPQPVPEPGTIILMGSGLAGMFFFRKKRQKDV